jgi:hypothetical protein
MARADSTIEQVGVLGKDRTQHGHLMGSRGRFPFPLASLWRWGSRIAALLLTLFWGAFFVEHFVAWVIQPAKTAQSPPLHVWIALVLHLAMLVSLLSMLVWSRGGAAFTLLSTALFFGWIGYRGSLWLPMINAIPVLLALIDWRVTRHLAGHADGAPGEASSGAAAPEGDVSGPPAPPSR